MFQFAKGIFVAVAIGTLLLASRADAHFVWVASEEIDGQSFGLLFFGESPDDREYHLPDSIAEAKLQLVTPDGETHDLKAEFHQEDGFVGLRAPTDITGDSAMGDFAVQSVVTYGVYHGTLLTYSAKHIHTSEPNNWPAVKSSGKMPLEIMPVATDDGIECRVLKDGKPVADAAITLVGGGTDAIEETTDAEGKAAFTPRQNGTIGFLANVADKSAKGQFGDGDYSSATFYTSVVVDYRPGSEQPGSENPENASVEPTQTSSAFPTLPEPVASFGAAVNDGWLYVYSGHTGGAHHHSRDNLLQKFLRLKMDGGTAWEELPMQTPLQGHPLVAHGDYLYRVGGMNAHNSPEEEEDLHSVDEFSRFDPRSNEWRELAPLPEPRSSHDAVVLGDRLYVVGGWELDGPGHGDWHYSAWSFDLTNPDGQWQPLTKPEFARRALAVAHWDGKIVALGGMTDGSEVSSQVDIYDPATREWTAGPELAAGEPDPDSPHGDISGFGISAWNLGGKLYVSGMSGVVYQLSDDGSAWLEVAELKTPRFFHRLLPGPDGSLLAVGGASFVSGHLDDTEQVMLIEKKVAAVTE
jgi:hypothetical protein